jgi:hypothetical protein
MKARLHATAFVLLCVAGAVAAVGLTVREVVRTAPIAMSVTERTRSGETTLVTVSVHNTTGSARCVSVRVAARDREGRDLAAVTATQALTVPPHARRTVRASLRLTPRQYAEQLHAYYPSSRPCEAG